MTDSTTPKPLNTEDPCQTFMQAFRGSFTSALRWPQLDNLWENLRERAAEGWYVYAIGEIPPTTKASVPQLLAFVTEIDQLLRTEHKENYCGIVYADNLQHPTFIKIYDPHNLGVSCGYSTNPPLPGWLLTKVLPCDLKSTQMQTKSRQRWWQRILSAGQ